LEPTFNGGNYIIGISFPVEWFWFVIVFLDEAVDRSL
jgi:hypothetical protein